MSKTYTFDDAQLSRLLHGTIEMFQEYRDVHGKSEENATFAAVGEMIEGLDAERELCAAGEAKPTLQIIPASGQPRYLNEALNEGAGVYRP